MVALVVALGGAGYSATGGNFILGQSNSASTQTRLVAPIDGPTLRVDNVDIGPNASGLQIVTNRARPPLVVNSSVKVANLNADLLDGTDSTGFVRGGGTVDGNSILIAHGVSSSLAPAVGGLIQLNYFCPVELSSNGTLGIKNVSSGTAKVFVDNGGGNPNFTQLAAGAVATFPASKAGEGFWIQASGAGLGVASIQVATVHIGNQCFAQTLQIVAT